MLEKGNGTFPLPPSSPRAASNDSFEDRALLTGLPANAVPSVYLYVFLSSTHLTSGKASVLLTSLNLGINISLPSILLLVLGKTYIYKIL